MDDLTALMGDLLHRYGAWAGPLLGLLTFGESLAFVGAVVPATAIMVVAGGMAGGGLIDPASLLAWCLIGGIAGDALSFWLGRRVGPAAIRHPWLRDHRRGLARTRLGFRRHGLLALTLYRFTGPVRAFVPLAAGMMSMPNRRFQALNVLSAVIWAPAMMAPSYLAAKGMGALNPDGRAFGLAAAVLIVGALCFVVLRIRGGRGKLSAI